jgi:hypothetical protein
MKFRSPFHQCFTHAFFVRKFVQGQTLIRKELLKRLSYKKCGRKMLMKLMAGLLPLHRRIHLLIRRRPQHREVKVRLYKRRPISSFTFLRNSKHCHFQNFQMYRKYRVKIVSKLLQKNFFQLEI